MARTNVRHSLSLRWLGNPLIIGILGLTACTPGAGEATPGTPAPLPSITSAPSTTAPGSLPPTAALPPGPELTRVAATIAADIAPLSTPLPENDRELISDDFENPASGWDVYADEDATASYDDGEYVLEVNTPRTRTLGLPHGVVFGDTIIYVSARRLSGPANAGFGVLCRYVDDDNYYFFLVTADNFAIIGKRVDGELIGLSSQVLLPIDPVLPGEAPNLLTAACVDDQLTLWVNAEFIVSAQDPDMPVGGNVGLLGTAFDQPGIRVAFDDLTVFAP